MNREAGATTTLLVGALLLRLAITGAHRRYVRPALGPFLILAGVVLIVLGATALIGTLRGNDEHEHDAREHGGVERVGWVLLGPVVALLLVAPPALEACRFRRTAARSCPAVGTDPVRLSLLSSPTPPTARRQPNAPP